MISKQSSSKSASLYQDDVQAPMTLAHNNISASTDDTEDLVLESQPEEEDLGDVASSIDKVSSL